MKRSAVGGSGVSPDYKSARGESNMADSSLYQESILNASKRNQKRHLLSPTLKIYIISLKVFKARLVSYKTL